ncbi:hypothetical protein B0H10DRAFT_2228737 [Mycena sp. CBHHK59/15]|nr:hypothetical protein B0H10DRAFT_2228737 [Mycena sp. CBHHK59/15]
MMKPLKAMGRIAHRGRKRVQRQGPEVPQDPPQGGHAHGGGLCIAAGKACDASAQKHEPAPPARYPHAAP